MYLIDTNVLSEARKGARAHAGVIAFFERAAAAEDRLYVSVISIGEVRRGLEMIRRRGDVRQTRQLEIWLDRVIEEYGDRILPFDVDMAQIWGRLRVPDPAHELDKQIAATALIYDLTVVTGNVANFAATGVNLKNPFLT